MHCGRIDPSHKSQNACVPNTQYTIQNRYVHIFPSEWRIAGYGTGALSDLKKIIHILITLALYIKDDT